MKPICGIYAFIHRDSGRCYVGSSVDVHRRRKAHLATARRGAKTMIHKELRNLGAENFDFEILEECSKAERFDREHFYIQFLDSVHPRGFNVCSNPLEKPDFTAVSKLKMSIAAKGRKMHPNTYAAIMSANVGRKKTQSEREKLSKSHKGKKRPSHIGENQRTRMTGRKLSLETREKMSRARFGRRPTEATRIKLRMAALNRSSTHKARLSVAAKKRHAKTHENNLTLHI